MSFLPLSSPPNIQQTIHTSAGLRPLPTADASNATSTPPPNSPSALPDPQILLNSGSLGPQEFAPFFTLLTTTNTPSQTHHPIVHYIFNTDDPDTDPITAAAIRIQEAPSSSPAPSATRTSNRQQDQDSGDTTSHEGRIYILIDMDSSGTKVLTARSMSPGWAVTATEVGAAPTWEGQAVQRREAREGMMLRIEGTELGEREDGSQSGLGADVMGTEVDTGKKLEALVDLYERKLGELRKVVDAAPASGQG